MNLLHRIITFVKRKHNTVPLEKCLSKEALSQAQEAANHLRRVHSVDVSEVAQGELAAMPKAVDPALEEALPKLRVLVQP